jgi:hypothetical protein
MWCQRGNLPGKPCYTATAPLVPRLMMKSPVGIISTGVPTGQSLINRASTGELTRQRIRQAILPGNMPRWWRAPRLKNVQPGICLVDSFAIGEFSINGAPTMTECRVNLLGLTVFNLCRVTTPIDPPLIGIAPLITIQLGIP